MSKVDDLRELTRQTRVRLTAYEDLRVQQRIIVVQSERRLRQSRRLLASSARRGAARE